MFTFPLMSDKMHHENKSRQCYSGTKKTMRGSENLVKFIEALSTEKFGSYPALFCKLAKKVNLMSSRGRNMSILFNTHHNYGLHLD